MIGLLTRNLVWKLISLAAAFAIWLAVANEPDLATIVSIPVEYKNFPRDLEISSNIVDSIEVEARGPSGLLRNIHDTRIAAIIDFANVKAPGERTFSVTGTEIKLPRGIELVRTIPAQLRFTFERHATRSVAVTVPVSGHLPQGMAIESLEITPPSLTVGGPASRVLTATRLTSDPLDLNTVRPNSEQTLSVFSAEPEVRILGAPQVKVKIRVSGRRQ